MDFYELSIKNLFDKFSAILYIPPCQQFNRNTDYKNVYQQANHHLWRIFWVVSYHGKRNDDIVHDEPDSNTIHRTQKELRCSVFSKSFVSFIKNISYSDCNAKMNDHSQGNRQSLALIGLLA